MTKKINRRKMLKLGAAAVVAPVVATVVISQTQAGRVRVASPAQKLLNERRSATLGCINDQQWTAQELAEMADQDRPALAFNRITPRLKPWTG